MVSLPENGLVHLRSPYSVPETVKRLESSSNVRNLAVFALIDHSGEAEEGRPAMRPTQLIIFGSPKAGTPLMVASPTLAIDLPLKGVDMGRCGWQGLALLQQPRLSQAAQRSRRNC